MSMNIKHIKHMSGHSISLKDKSAMSGENTTHLTEHIIQANIKTGMSDEGNKEHTLMSENAGVKTPSNNDIQEIESPDSIDSPFNRKGM